EPSRGARRSGRGGTIRGRRSTGCSPDRLERSAGHDDTPSGCLSRFGSRAPDPARRSRCTNALPMLIALAITLLLFLGLLRHLLEPACPGCAAKRWARGSTTLHCAECGWTNVAA